MPVSSGFWCSTGGAQIRLQRQRRLRFRQCFFVPQKWASAKLQIPGPSNIFKFNDIDSYTQNFESEKTIDRIFIQSISTHILKNVGRLMDPKNCVKHFRETKSQINWTLEMKIGKKKKKKVFFAKESETLKTERLSPDVWFPKILNSNYHWDDNGGEKIYITYQKPIYKFNLIFSQSNFTFHPPSTPKPHWSNHGGSNAWCHDVDMAPKRLPPGGPRKIRFFPPCPSNSATQSSFLSFREVLGSVLASWVCSNRSGGWRSLYTFTSPWQKSQSPLGKRWLNFRWPNSSHWSQNNKGLQTHKKRCRLFLLQQILFRGCRGWLFFVLLLTWRGRLS